MRLLFHDWVSGFIGFIIRKELQIDCLVMQPLPRKKSYDLLR